MKPFPRLCRLNEMTRPQRAVAVAKDVIAQIKARRYRVSSGQYVKFGTIVEDSLSTYRGKSLRTALEEIDPRCCFVCAAGSAFVSAVRLFNEFDIVGFVSFDRRAESFLVRCIGKRNILLTELAFERGAPGLMIHEEEKIKFSRAIYDWAALFGKRYTKPEERLIAIMQNVIRNKGNFKP